MEGTRDEGRKGMKGGHGMLLLPSRGRPFLRREACSKISDSVLASSKAYLKSNLAQRMNEPEYWLDAIAKRYLDGKDFTTSYAAKIDAVTADKVKMLLGELNSGSKVEYVVNKK